MTLNTEEFAKFCKKKGFIYPSSEIYGGISGFYDYGHLGTKLKRNFENQWREFFLGLHDNFHEIDAANIMHPGVFQASGHLENFTDPVAVSEDGHSERADHLLEKHLKERFEGLSPEEMMELFKKHKINSSISGKPIVDVTTVNMMFPVEVGVGKTTTAFLRPETAQSPFVNFRLQFEILRKRLPMGLALLGRAYRNEISPRNLTLRLRELQQAELQIFFNPSKIDQHDDFTSIEKVKLNVLLADKRKGGKDFEQLAVKDLLKAGLPKFYVYHLAKIQEFYFGVLGYAPENFRLYQLDGKEKAFYNKYHFDIEIKLNNHGWTELGGLHYRTDHDLAGHEKVSKTKMEVLDESTGEKFIPHVLELSFGIDRNVYGLIDTNLVSKEDAGDRGNAILKFPDKLAPFFVAIFPLVKNKEPVLNKAKEVHELLRKGFACFYDESGSVGRRYARADELGIPYCITVDFESLEDECVTIRNRDSGEQERVAIKELRDKLFSLYIQ